MIYMIYFSHKFHTEKPTVHVCISSLHFCTVNEEMKPMSECLMWKETWGRLTHCTVRHLQVQSQSHKR
jgi:hypothetical protein